MHVTVKNFVNQSVSQQWRRSILGAALFIGLFVTIALTWLVVIYPLKQLGHEVTPIVLLFLSLVSLAAACSYKWLSLMFKPSRLIEKYVVNRLVEDINLALSKEAKKLDENEHRRKLAEIIGRIDAIVDDLFTSGHRVGYEQGEAIINSFRKMDAVMLIYPFDRDMRHVQTDTPTLMESAYPLFAKAMEATKTNENEALLIYEDLKNTIREWLKDAEIERLKMLKEIKVSAVRLQKSYSPKKIAASDKSAVA